MKRWWAAALIAATLTPAAVPHAAAQASPQAQQAYEAGRAAMQRKDWATALASFERAAADATVAPAARLHMGLIREQTGKQAEAVSTYRDLLATRNVPGEVQTAASDRLVAIAFERLQKQDAAGAEVALAPLDRSTRTDALHAWLPTLASQQKWSQLETKARQLLEKEPAGMEAWAGVHLALSKLTEAAATDPARAAEAAKLRKRLDETTADTNSLPLAIEGLAVNRSGKLAVAATLVGPNKATPGWCTLNFYLTNAQGHQRAYAQIPAPGANERRNIVVPTLSELPGDTRVFNMHYDMPYCEQQGAAAATPPQAMRKTLDGCPETLGEARALLQGREPLGGNWRVWPYETRAYPAGGIRLFGTQVTRMVVKQSRSGNLFHFGLPGAHANWVDRLKRAYPGKEISCWGGAHCSGQLNAGYGDKATRVTLVDPGWPEGMLPKGTYLQCLYR